MSGGDLLRWHVSWWRPLVLWPVFFTKTLRHRRPVPVLQVLREAHLSWTFLVVLYGTLPLLVVAPKTSPSTWPLALAATMVAVAWVFARWESMRHWPSSGAPPEMLAGVGLGPGCDSRPLGAPRSGTAVEAVVSTG